VRVHNAIPSRADAIAVLVSRIITSIALAATIPRIKSLRFFILSPSKKLCPAGSIQHINFIDFSEGGVMMEKVQRLRRQRKVNIPSMLPIVELVGQGRLLIENHQGVLSYSTEEIKIKVCYGCVIITGEKLQLMEMSRIKLAICGRIDGLQILGR